MSRLSIVLSAAMVAAIIVSPRAARAQAGPTLSVTGGYTNYDLSGTGNTGFAALAFEFPIASFAVIEPRLGFMSYGTQGSDTRVHLFPEAQIQAELPLGSVRPYLGAGLGVSFGADENRSLTDLTLSGAGGVRVNFGAGWGLGGELRIRVVDPWVGTTADFGLSVRRRL